MGKQGRGCSSRYGSERLLYPVQVNGGGHGAADHLADLDEEDVWSVLAPAPAPDSGNGNGRQPEQDRRGGRWTAGGLSMAFEATAATAHHHHRPHVMASSAPVKVPEWPAARFSPSGGGEQQQQQQYYGVSCREEEDEWVAPHEYLQARSGGRGTPAPSVFEGVGRTLKGRDLSRVRDAVWSSTGFFG
ncbi:uncharacterized protein LOC124672298 [Lolium rigidum]|uniref:uncharacterized protein LOC124672298 n=1 Tax=Lolium rigidum TaxID=89674 RepID=UPI001F5D0EA3|nr:uncharacterized protein LOC124672298 [Lolium rigidum]